MSNLKDHLPATELQLEMLDKYMRKGYIKKNLNTLGLLTRKEAGNLILASHEIMRVRRIKD